MGDFLRQKEIESQYKNDYIDLDGNPVSRIPNIYPTCYSEFVVHKSADFKKSDMAASCVSLFKSNQKAFKAAAREVFNCKAEKGLFYGKTFEDMQRFIDVYSNGRMKLTAVTQACNANDGSPYWVLYYSLNDINK